METSYKNLIRPLYTCVTTNSITYVVQFLHIGGVYVIESVAIYVGRGQLKVVRNTSEIHYLKYFLNYTN